jgi:dTDP-4-amino-4,6-dideoxygalactose transaminase
MIKKIKLFDPIIGKSEEKITKKILSSKFWASGAGAGYVKKFENDFKKIIGSQKCFAVNSGTAALHLALSLYNIKNKEVIIPSLSFVSTAHAVLYNGGIPIFADVDLKTLCIDPDDVKKKINKKTAMILPVHFAGMSCDLTKINELTKNKKLTVVEDAAHACGAKFKGKRIGSHSNTVCFSFHPVKNLAMPTGGLIAINNFKDKKIMNEILAKRWCGITDRKNFEYDVKEIGWNYYMNEISAGIGCVQLKKLDKSNKKRIAIGKKFSMKMNVEQKMPYSIDSVYHFYWILVKNREKFIDKMKKNGIETGIHYKPIHQMSLYKNNQNVPNTEILSKQVVSLPTHPNLTTDEIGFIIESVNKYAESTL